MIKIENSHKLTLMKQNSVSKRFLLISIQSFVLLLMTMNIFAGTVHTVGGSVTYTGGGFPISATISAYIVSRPSEVEYGTYYPGSGQYAVQCERNKFFADVLFNKLGWQNGQRCRNRPNRHEKKMIGLCRHCAKQNEQ